MAKVTIGYGILLSILGLVGFFATGGQHPTALIPLFFGLPVIGLGSAALNEKRRKHAMHAAATLGLLGFFGTARGLAKLCKLLADGTGEPDAAIFAKSIMALLSAIFIVLCVKSFRDARRRRATQG